VPRFATPDLVYPRNQEKDRIVLRYSSKVIAKRVHLFGAGNATVDHRGLSLTQGYFPEFLWLTSKECWLINGDLGFFTSGLN
jgi:hypothetical protein